MKKVYVGSLLLISACLFSFLHPFIVTSQDGTKIDFPLETINPSAILTEFAQSNPEGSILSISLSSQQISFAQNLLTLFVQHNEDQFDVLITESIKNHKAFANVVNALDVFKLDEALWVKLIDLIKKKIGFDIYPYMDFFKDLVPGIRYKIGRTQDIAPLSGESVNIIARVWDPRFDVVNLLKASKIIKAQIEDMQEIPDVLSLGLTPDELNALCSYLRITWNARLKSLKESKAYENTSFSEEEILSIKKDLGSDSKRIAYLLVVAENLEMDELKKIVLNVIEGKLLDVLKTGEIGGRDFIFLIDTIDKLPSVQKDIRKFVLFNNQSLTKTIQQQEGVSAVTAVAFSKDSKLLGGGFANGKVIIWDVADNYKELKSMRQFQLMTRVNRLDFIDNTNIVAIIPEEYGEELIEFSFGSAGYTIGAFETVHYHAKFEPQTKLYKMYFDQGALSIEIVRIVTSWIQGTRFDKILNINLATPHHSVFFSSNEKYVVVVTNDNQNKTVSIYDLQTKKLIKTFTADKKENKKEIVGVDISADGSMILMVLRSDNSNNDGIVLQSLATGNELCSINFEKGKINQAILSDNNMYIAMALEKGQIIIINVKSLLSFLGNAQQKIKELLTLLSKQFTPSIEEFVPQSRAEYLEVPQPENVEKPQLQNREQKVSYLRALYNRLKRFFGYNS